MSNAQQPARSQSSCPHVTRAHAAHVSTAESKEAQKAEERFEEQLSEFATILIKLVKRGETLEKSLMLQDTRQKNRAGKRGRMSRMRSNSPVVFPEMNSSNNEPYTFVSTSKNKVNHTIKAFMEAMADPDLAAMPPGLYRRNPKTLVRSNTAAVAGSVLWT